LKQPLASELFEHAFAVDLFESKLDLSKVCMELGFHYLHRLVWPLNLTFFPVTGDGFSVAQSILLCGCEKSILSTAYLKTAALSLPALSAEEIDEARDEMWRNESLAAMIKLKSAAWKRVDNGIYPLKA
jgi:hypothetical protein